MLAASLLCGRVRFVGFGSARRRSPGACLAPRAPEAVDSAVDCEVMDELLSTGACESGGGWL